MSKQENAMDLNIDEFKNLLKLQKTQFQELINQDKEYDGEADMLMAVIDNLEEDLKGVKDLDTLDLHKQARVFASLCFFAQLQEEFINADEDFDEDELEFEEDEDDEE